MKPTQAPTVVPTSASTTILDKITFIVQTINEIQEIIQQIINDIQMKIEELLNSSNLSSRPLSLVRQTKTSKMAHSTLNDLIKMLEDITNNFQEFAANNVNDVSQIEMIKNEIVTLGNELTVQLESATVESINQLNLMLNLTNDLDDGLSDIKNDLTTTTAAPTTAPSSTSIPTSSPTSGPTYAPTNGPSVGPTSGPTGGPTDEPTGGPTPTTTPTPTSTASTGSPTIVPTTNASPCAMQSNPCFKCCLDVRIYSFFRFQLYKNLSIFQITGSSQHKFECFP